MPDGNRRSYRAIGRSLAALVLALALEQPVIGAEKANVSHAQSQATQNSAPVPIDLSPAQWPWQAQKNHETYYFYPYAAHEADKGSDAFLGVSSGMWVAIFTFALVIATCVQAILILRAEALTRAALRLSQRQAARAKMDTQKSLKISERNAEVAEKTLNRLEAPYVYPSRLRYFSEANRIDQNRVIAAPCLGVVFKNYGRSPAKLQRAMLRFTVSDSRTGGTPKFTRSENFSFANMLGEQDTSDEVKLGPMQGAAQFMNDINDGKTFLIVFVSIMYEDVFGDDSGNGTLYHWNPQEQAFRYGVPPPQPKK